MQTKIQATGIDNILNIIITEFFLNLEKEMAIQVQKTFRIPNRKEHFPHHDIVKTLSIKNKQRILKDAREKHQDTYKGNHIIMTADFSTEPLKARRA
jgi:hypothetical protein